MAFQKAVKYDAKLRLLLAGVSGSGKTYTSLMVATNLTDKPIAFIDTEHGSASKYADLFDFDVVNMEPPFAVDRFLEFIAEAETAGYGAVIIDSLSHAWSGTGGLLEEVDKAAARMKNPNSFVAWKEVTPMYNQLVEGIIRADLHVIVCLRAKSDYILEDTADGKRPRKVGLAAIQREGFEYEFDVALEMDLNNTAVVSKTRCPVLVGQVIKKPGIELAHTLQEWLTGAPARAFTTEQAVEVLSPGGNKLGNLNDEQLVTLTRTISPKVTPDMRTAAKVLLKSHSLVSDRAALVD